MNLINKDNHLCCTYHACNGTTYSQQNVLQENVCTVGIPKIFENKNTACRFMFSFLSVQARSHTNRAKQHSPYTYTYTA